MRIYQNKPFQRFARKENIRDSELCDAVERADRGLVDADLGGGVIKQRIARQSQGRSGGFRSIILYRSQERAFFVYGFSKSSRANITAAELADLKDLAEMVLNYDAKVLQAAIAADAWKEVDCHK